MLEFGGNKLAMNHVMASVCILITREITSTQNILTNRILSLYYFKTHTSSCGMYYMLTFQVQKLYYTSR